jgi:hypothetical protein
MPWRQNTGNITLTVQFIIQRKLSLQLARFVKQHGTNASFSVITCVTSRFVPNQTSTACAMFIQYFMYNKKLSHFMFSNQQQYYFCLFTFPNRWHDITGTAWRTTIIPWGQMKLPITSIGTRILVPVNSSAFKLLIFIKCAEQMERCERQKWSV